MMRDGKGWVSFIFSLSPFDAGGGWVGGETMFLFSPRCCFLGGVLWGMGGLGYSGFCVGTSGMEEHNGGRRSRWEV